MIHELAKLDTLSAAKWLLGKKLGRTTKTGVLSGTIVETEAYLGASDMAAHSYNGETPRTKVMFGPPGHLYVYFTYGMHYCINVVTAPVGTGEAVLIRALEPVEGLKIMQINRGGVDGHNLTNGPAKLAQALDIDKALNGHILSKVPLRLQVGQPVKSADIVQTTRIGISKSKDLKYRFYIRNNPLYRKNSYATLGVSLSNLCVQWGG